MSKPAEGRERPRPQRELLTGHPTLSVGEVEAGVTEGTPQLVIPRVSPQKSKIKLLRHEREISTPPDTGSS